MNTKTAPTSTIKSDAPLCSINPDLEPEYHQAVQEVLADVSPWAMNQSRYAHPELIQAMTIPDRIIEFKVSWLDDQQVLKTNKGYRVQFSQALGPYKGGLRFHPTVNASIFKFLGFEQLLKNSLTGLPLGAGKGGSDFDPKGKSLGEIKRFCAAFMQALWPFIGQERDIPAGDIGVGSRELGFLYGQAAQMSPYTTFGILTGKALHHGGSQIRPEATGYGCVYFLAHMLKHHNLSIQGKSVLISGAGNVALFAAEKILQLGASVKTLSDSQGTLIFEESLTLQQLLVIKEKRFQHGLRLAAIANDHRSCSYYAGIKPWSLGGDIALPCATQNEINLHDAQELCQQQLMAIAEGANMPCTPEAIEYFQQHKVLYGPGKAANAGGVAVSGLEMVQNNMGYTWNREQVDTKLQDIMLNIHQACISHADYIHGVTNYAQGANIAGFKRVADALIDTGILIK